MVDRARRAARRADDWQQHRTDGDLGVHHRQRGAASIGRRSRRGDCRRAIFWHRARRVSLSRTLRLALCQFQPARALARVVLLCHRAACARASGAISQRRFAQPHRRRHRDAAKFLRARARAAACRAGDRGVYVFLLGGFLDSPRVRHPRVHVLGGRRAAGGGALDQPRRESAVDRDACGADHAVGRWDSRQRRFDRVRARGGSVRARRQAEPRVGAVPGADGVDHRRARRGEQRVDAPGDVVDAGDRDSTGREWKIERCLFAGTRAGGVGKF